MTTNNTSMLLDVHIDDATLALRRLTLQRQIQEVKLQRHTSKAQHARLLHDHEYHTSDINKRLHSVLHGRNQLKDYTEAVECLYDTKPPHYVVRQHAELVKVVRSQEVFQTFIRLVEQQNNEIIASLEYTKHQMQCELQIQRDQRKDRASMIQEQLVQRFIQKVQASAPKATMTVGGKYPERSILQSLILRKASNRVFVM